VTTRASTTVAPAAPPVTQPELKRAGPCTLVIFGAGDLLHRKLMPSLFHLMMDGLLSDEFAVITVARESMDDRSFRAKVVDALRTFLPDHAQFDPRAGERFAERLGYISGELDDSATYTALRERLAEADARLPGASGRLF
jgi:glucose-6-phosphate 1-dehydrogenase